MFWAYTSEYHVDPALGTLQIFLGPFDSAVDLWRRAKLNSTINSLVTSNVMDSFATTPRQRACVIHMSIYRSPGS